MTTQKRVEEIREYVKEPNGILWHNEGPGLVRELLDHIDELEQERYHALRSVAELQKELKTEREDKAEMSERLEYLHHKYEAPELGGV